MARLYEVLFYNGWQDVPAYYLVGSVEGRSPTQALAKHLAQAVRDVRDQLFPGLEVEDRYIWDSLYVLKSGGLVAASRLVEP